MLTHFFDVMTMVWSLLRHLLENLTYRFLRQHAHSQISCETGLVEVMLVLGVSESAISLCDSIRQGMKHSTIALVGSGSEVKQLIQGVIVGLDGVDVLVVRVVGVHHHTQLSA